jgi:hypothetical protein
MDPQHEACILTVSHRHGNDTTLHADEQAARVALAQFARQWWHEIADYEGRASPGVTGPPPDDDDETIRMYFDHQDDEHYTITPAAMPSGPRPDRQLTDAAGLDAIQHMLCDPDWGVGMLEDIAAIIIRTGRGLANPSNQPTWARH